MGRSAIRLRSYGECCLIVGPRMPGAQSGRVSRFEFTDDDSCLESVSFSVLGDGVRFKFLFPILILNF